MKTTLPTGASVSICAARPLSKPCGHESSDSVLIRYCLLFVNLRHRQTMSFLSVDIFSKQRATFCGACHYSVSCQASALWYLQHSATRRARLTLRANRNCTLMIQCKAAIGHFFARQNGFPDRCPRVMLRV